MVRQPFSQASIGGQVDNASNINGDPTRNVSIFK
jgi:hypothetical protein